MGSERAWPLAGILILVLGVHLAAGQSVDQLSAMWLPTDGNLALLNRLSNADVTQRGNAIAGNSILGVIPISFVADWIDELTTNPSFRDGTITWMPTTPYKCSQNNAGCHKLVKVTVLEFNFVNPNATDCKGYGLVAADAILPQAAVLTDGVNTFPALGRVQYEITAAPNSTAGACTYVVQYPKPVRDLANQLCDASCFNSPCIPCNANQTITGPDLATNCSASSGIAPSLVAAIQGAAQCLANGPLGRYQCQVAFSQNASACASMSCFPGDATVVIEGRGARQMKDVRIGDRVQVALADGSLAYDDVYFFGHRDRAAVASFVQLVLESLEEGGQGGKRVLELSPLHFVPVAADRAAVQWSRRIQRRGRDVEVGDVIWAQGGEKQQGVLQPFRVAEKGAVVKRGLWNPYTAAGTIVVGGVAASVHSEWFLDGVLERLGRTDLLPALYQTLLLPVRVAYSLMGPAAMRSLDERLDLGEVTSRPGAALARMLPVAGPSIALLCVLAPVAYKLQQQRRR